ncbi:MAG: hypothetical protein ACTSQE_17145 [Candidatus Heimdallarchaeaceae archaeon]
MKSLGKFTLRGEITPTANTGTYEEKGDLQRLLLFDGDFGTGFKVTKFVVWAFDATSSADCSAIIATDKQGLANYNLGTQSAEDVRQIGWASGNAVTSAVREESISVVDRDNLVVEDLWIAGYNASSGDKRINYYIELEKFDVGLNVGSYSMVRNSSQDITV